MQHQQGTQHAMPGRAYPALMNSEQIRQEQDYIIKQMAGMAPELVTLDAELEAAKAAVHDTLTLGQSPTAHAVARGAALAARERLEAKRKELWSLSEEHERLSKTLKEQVAAERARNRREPHA